MKNKILFSLIPAALLVLTSCGGKNVTPTGEVYTSDDISLKSVSLTMDTYEYYQFAVKNEELNKKVAWVSTDISVASIDKDGLMYSRGSGTATIKASYGNLSSSCTVNVSSSGSAIILKTNVDEIGLFPGEVFNVSVETYFKGELVNDAKLSWSSNDENVALAMGSNYSCSVKALSSGNTQIFVSTTYKGIFINTPVNVTVYSNDAKVDFKNLPLGEDNTYSLGVKKGASYKLLYDIYLNDEIISYSLVFSSDDANIAYASNDIVYAKEVGETIITGQYNDLIEVNIKVTVSE